NLEIEQIANGVAVLGSVQAMKRLRSARVRSIGLCPIERRLYGGNERVHRRFIGTWRSQGRHRSGTKLAHRLFHDVGGRTGLRHVHALQRETAGLHSIVVTGDTVALERRTRIDVRSPWRRRDLRGGTEASQDEDAAQGAVPTWTHD